MPEDNRFAGLGEAVDDEGSSAEPEDESATKSADGDPGSESASETVEYNSTEDADADTEANDSNADTEDDGTNSSDSGNSSDPSAFPFDATKKKTVYVRPETLEELEDARALVDAQLRTQHDVRNLTGREFYDAVFRYAAADTDGLIEEILDARDE